MRPATMALSCALLVAACAGGSSTPSTPLASQSAAPVPPSASEVPSAAPGASASSSASAGTRHYADVYVGAYPTSLVHAVDREYPMRVFLLHNGDKALAIELADAPNGGSDYPDWFAAAEPVVEGLSFAGS